MFINIWTSDLRAKIRRCGMNLITINMIIILLYIPLMYIDR